MKNKVYFFVSFCLVLFSIKVYSQNHVQTLAKLEQGTYWGYIKADQQKEKLALQAYFYLESSEDFTKFPQLNTILKINLGSYNSTEYTTQSYKNIQYDFDNNILTLDEPNNDLVISAKVTNENGRTKIYGEVWIRSTAQSGILILESESDEPEDSFILSKSTLQLNNKKSRVKKGKVNDIIRATNISDPIPFAPKIDGQYVGKCKGEKALFQIQTMRGLSEQNSRDGNQLFDYEIIARLGYWRKMNNDSEKRPWTVYSSFAGGIYNIFTGNLIFLGPSSSPIECQLSGGNLKCNYHSRDELIPCEFNLENKSEMTVKKYPRLYHVNPQKEQLKDLPSANPPSNLELTKALSGHFIGYLHHESYDRYQPVAFHVIPSSSSENPHNPNKMFISTTSIMYFGRTPGEQFITQRYEPRSFYLRPGFTLGAPGTDSFIIIQEWKAGYIRGTWYSHNFGRVGTIELVKGNEIAPLPANVKMFQPWQGEFEGPTSMSPDTKRWFRIIFPNQPAERLESTVLFAGSYLTNKSDSTLTPMERGRFDPYTGAIGWLFSKNNGLGMVSGKVNEERGLLLYWPPSPNIFSATMGDYKLELYK